jgi:hypothetical protein
VATLISQQEGENLDNISNILKSYIKNVNFRDFIALPTPPLSVIDDDNNNDNNDRNDYDGKNDGNGGNDGNNDNNKNTNIENTNSDNSNDGNNNYNDYNDYNNTNYNDIPEERGGKDRAGSTDDSFAIEEKVYFSD